MPPLHTLVVFAGAALALLLVPGPAVWYILARSTAQGRRAGLASVLGVHAGSVVHVVAAAVGLSAVVVASAAAFTVVKVAGGCYLLVAGLRVLWANRRRRGGPTEAAAVLAEDARAPRRLFVDGMVVNVLNPKVALFFLAFLPQFVSPDHGPVWTQTLVLGACYIGVGLCSDSGFALLGAQAGRWLRARPGVRRRSRDVEGAVMVGLGLTTVLLPHRRPTA